MYTCADPVGCSGWLTVQCCSIALWGQHDVSVKFSELYIGALDVVSLLFDSPGFLVHDSNSAVVQEWLWACRERRFDARVHTGQKEVRDKEEMSWEPT